MNLLDEVDKIKKDGYSEANAEAKLCQDIIIKAISQSSLGYGTLNHGATSSTPCLASVRA